MTVVAVEPGVGRPRLTLVGGALAPRVLSSDATGARVALVATTALLLGGDRVEVELRVGPGAWLEIVETAGTVAYDADGELSTWTVRAAVGAGGLLLWHGEPLVVSSGANTLRDSSFDLGESATVCLRETLVLGRSGEQGGALRTRTTARRGGVPLLVEELDLTELVDRRQPGMLGGTTIVDTVTWLGGPSPLVPTVDPGSRFELADHAGTVARVLRRDTAGSPARAWWAAWSRAARVAYREHPAVSEQHPTVSAATPAPQRLAVPTVAGAPTFAAVPTAAAVRTPEPVGRVPRSAPAAPHSPTAAMRPN